MKPNLSIVILTSQGPRHSYFCHELARHFEVRGIVVDDRYHFRDRLWAFFKGNNFNPWKIARSVSLKSQLAPYEVRDEKIEARFFPIENGRQEFPAGIPVLKSRDPNDEKTLHWVRERSPDFLAVFGTRLIREPLLSLPRLAALNLHTGLSPHYRGGQCTFWCLYEGDLEHVGVTVHHLSSKIDGGDIVYTAHPDVDSDDTVRSLECKLAQLGTGLMIRAFREIAEGRAPRIPQKERGRLLLSKDYTLEKRLELERRLEKSEKAN